MASKANSPGLDDLDNYFLDGDLDDDPFASPSGKKSDSNKRKKPGDGLGLDEEVSVEKKARVPRIKLDQERYACHAHHPMLLQPLTHNQTTFAKGHTRTAKASQGLEAQGERARGMIMSELTTTLHQLTKHLSGATLRASSLSTRNGLTTFSQRPSFSTLWPWWRRQATTSR